ncbi:hypothetical protein SASPL_156072 [Salvia splendens]|uniref:Trichome birefringence-like N-terminal domain-containing protein n=1 Tax=Salvia splendens TaxID=180675 RepID=A0A8X8VXC1_SALSN|nr:hypothetical protein SASPL_156072 [Salvia splendens]
MVKKSNVSSDFLAAAVDVRCSFQTLVVLLVAALVVGAVYLTAESGYLMQEDEEEQKVRPAGCDLFSGRWVYDNESYPLYKEEECTFMSDQLACGKFGRSDLNFQHWRWQPHQCDLPRRILD